MTGIVNSTGAKSGIIGTTVGTSAGSTSASDLTSGTLNRSLMGQGTVIKTSFYTDENVAAQITTSSATFQAASGLELSHVTEKSSTYSYLVYELFSGMVYQSVTQDAVTDVTMKTVSETDYDDAESITDTAATFGGAYYYRSVDNIYYPVFLRYYCGLGAGMGMPATKTAWDAGDTLYFRFFFKTSTGAFAIAHINTTLNITITEIAL